MKIEIQLKFSRQNFEEIYFKDNQGDYWRSGTTKSAFITLILMGAILIFILVYALIADNYRALIFFGILFIVAAFNYVSAFRVLYKWKSKIFDFLDREEKYQNCKILLTDKSFTLIQDGIETIESWANFSSVKISDEYISMEGNEHFIFPCEVPPKI